MRPEGMAGDDVGVIEIIRSIAAHADTLHDPA
jgi:hypothetical protein